MIEQPVAAANAQSANTATAVAAAEGSFNCVICMTADAGTERDREPLVYCATCKECRCHASCLQRWLEREQVVSSSNAEPPSFPYARLDVDGVSKQTLGELHSHQCVKICFGALFRFVSLEQSAKIPFYTAPTATSFAAVASVAEPRCVWCRKALETHLVATGNLVDGIHTPSRRPSRAAVVGFCVLSGLQEIGSFLLAALLHASLLSVFASVWRAPTSHECARLALLCHQSALLLGNHALAWQRRLRSAKDAFAYDTPQSNPNHWRDLQPVLPNLPLRLADARESRLYQHSWQDRLLDEWVLPSTANVVPTLMYRQRYAKHHLAARRIRVLTKSGQAAPVPPEHCHTVADGSASAAADSTLTTALCACFVVLIGDLLTTVAFGDTVSIGALWMRLIYSFLFALGRATTRALYDFFRLYAVPRRFGQLPPPAEQRWLVVRPHESIA